MTELQIQLYRAVCKNDTDQVRSLLRGNPSLLSFTVYGKTSYIMQPFLEQWKLLQFVLKMGWRSMCLKTMRKALLSIVPAPLESLMRHNNSWIMVLTSMVERRLCTPIA